MFEDVLATVEQRLDLPYPDRAELLDELAADLDAADLDAADLDAAYLAWRERGLAEPDARAAALREVDLGEGAILELARVHRSAAGRVLARMPPPARDWLEALATALPFALATSRAVD